MKHASSREFFGYWNQCRGRRPAPERDDIEPGAVRRSLGDSLLLSVDRTAGHPFRLAGTRLCALFCRELKGEPFARLWEAGSRAQIETLIDTVADETTGVVAGASGRADGDTVALELLLLPLAGRGRPGMRVIGALAPLGLPYWLGTRPIGLLTLGAFRHVGPGAEPVAGRRLVTALRVIEGGRAENGARP